MKFRYLKQYNLLSKCKFYCFLIQFCAFSLLFVTDMNAQKYKSVRDVEVSIPGGGETIFEIFEQIEAQTDYRFSYDQKKIKQKDVKLNLAAGKKSVADLLLEISQRSNLRFKQINNAINVKEREEGNDDRLKVVIDEKARQGIRIKGKVTNENEGPIPGASVVEKGTSNGI
ncbi:MAG: carboxypeptidase-like regulatory domain-containing protein, partial [Cytophagales bacterium]|nr:carboxypeptidase-like regulatory domain-containing protein [Cytophagales bacterium]